MGLALAVFVSAATVANPLREQDAVPWLVTAIAKPALLAPACPLVPNSTVNAPEEQVETVAAAALVVGDPSQPGSGSLTEPEGQAWGNFGVPVGREYVELPCVIPANRKSV